MAAPSFRIAGPDQGIAGHGTAAKLRRNSLCVRGQAQVDVPLQIERRFSHEVTPEFKKLPDVRLRTQSFRQHHGCKRMELDFKFSHYAKIAAASTQRPEQICVLAGIRAYDGAVRRYQLKALNVIA